MKIIDYNTQIYLLLKHIEKRIESEPKSIGYHNIKKQQLIKNIMDINDKIQNGYKFDKKKYIKILSMIETVYLLPNNI